MATTQSRISFIAVFTVAISSCLVVGVTSASNAVPILQIGQLCSENSTCSNSIPNSYCDSQAKLECNVSICSCLPTHIAIPLNSSDSTNVTCLLKPIDIGDDCQHDTQCIFSFGELSTCEFPPDENASGTCQCSDSTVLCTNTYETPHLKRCRPRQQFGEYCHPECGNDQCSHIPNAICKEGLPYRCDCDETHFLHEGSTCIPKALLGDKCDIHPSQCKFASNSYCDPDTLTCVCNSTTHVNSTSNACYPKREYLGMECQWSEQQQCLPENSRCVYERGAVDWYAYTCRCNSTEYTESLLTPNTCIKVATSINSVCTEDVQCTAGVPGVNSECSHDTVRTCRCKERTVFNPVVSTKHGLCYPMSPISGPCEIPEQCFDKSGSATWTTCAMDPPRCRCSIEASLLGGVCYKDLQLGDKCEIDAECMAYIGGTVLCDKTTKTCACDEGYAPIRDTTYGPRCAQRDLLHGDYCSEDWQCYGPLIGSTECNNVVCRCTEGFVYSEEMQYCVKKDTE